MTAAPKSAHSLYHFTPGEHAQRLLAMAESGVIVAGLATTEGLLRDIAIVSTSGECLLDTPVKSQSLAGRHAPDWKELDETFRALTLDRAIISFNVRHTIQLIQTTADKNGVSNLYYKQLPRRAECVMQLIADYKTNGHDCLPDLVRRGPNLNQSAYKKCLTTLNLLHAMAES